MIVVEHEAVSTPMCRGKHPSQALHRPALTMQMEIEDPMGNLSDSKQIHTSDESLKAWGILPSLKA